jgi:hypothetical protein
MSVHDKAGPLHVFLNIGKNQDVITSSHVSGHMQQIFRFQMERQAYVGRAAAIQDIRETIKAHLVLLVLSTIYPRTSHP